MRTDPGPEGVRYLLAEYCHAFDDGRADDWAALFTDAGSFGIDGLGDLHGRNQIAGFVSEATAALSAAGIVGINHLTLNSAISVGTDRAEVVSDLAMLMPAETGFSVFALGRYRDVLIHHDRWRFDHRQVCWFGGQAPPALLAILRPVFAGLSPVN